MTSELYEKLNAYAEAFQHIRKFLNEKERRLFLAETAIQFGYGAGMVLSERTGVSYSTIRRGVKEALTGGMAEEGRIRRSGAGRKAAEEICPDIIGVAKEIPDDETYGSPEGGKWRSRSLRNIAKELAEKGIATEKSAARRIVKELGCNRQQNRKMEQVGEASPGRDEQFEFIRSQRDEATKEGAPVISADTKRKENLEKFKNDGTEYRPSGSSRRVCVFISALGKVAPYGVHVLNDNAAFVNLGASADTGAFSAESVRRWRYAVGRENAKRIVITADCGGGNGHRNRLWKLSLAALADEIGKGIEVLHYPPGTSKYNKVEHRLFCHITQHWQGKPFINVQTVVNLIRSATTETGLNVACTLDKNIYEAGIKVTDAQFNAIDIGYIGPHYGWPYIKGFRISQ